ncbi:MAG: hypothetical protein MHMPM18_004976 [Marteilia pararefringens]
MNLSKEYVYRPLMAIEKQAASLKKYEDIKLENFNNVIYEKKQQQQQSEMHMKLVEIEDFHFREIRRIKDSSVAEKKQRKLRNKKPKSKSTKQKSDQN